MKSATKLVIELSLEEAKQIVSDLDDGNDTTDNEFYSILNGFIIDNDETEV